MAGSATRGLHGLTIGANLKRIGKICWRGAERKTYENVGKC